MDERTFKVQQAVDEHRKFIHETAMKMDSATYFALLESLAEDLTDRFRAFEEETR